jgi:hypothetical protein
MLEFASPVLAFAAGSAIALDPAKCISGLGWNVLGAETDCDVANAL